MKDHNKKQPIKNLGDIIRKNAISKKDFISRISQYKNVKYFEMVFKKEKENLYFCAVCNVEDFKEDMPKKPFDPDQFTKDLILNVKVMIQNEIFPILEKIENRLDKIEARLDKVEARLDKVEARLDKVEKDITEIKKDVAMLKSFRIKDIEEYNKNMANN